MVFYKKTLARKKGDKDYTKSEKQLLTSFNDYSLFGATDSEVIQMLSKKIGKKISETLFYRLKKEAKKKRGDSEQWLDYFVKYQYVEYHRKRMEELEFVQRTLLKVLIEEKEKSEDKKDKSLINHLAKTIADNSKVLSDFGNAPHIISFVKDVISENYFNSQAKNKHNEEIKVIKNNLPNAKDGFCLKLNDESSSLDYEESQRVF